MNHLLQPWKRTQDLNANGLCALTREKKASRQAWIKEKAKFVKQGNDKQWHKQQDIWVLKVKRDIPPKD